MFRKIINYLNLRQAGGLELFFALLMVLSAYSFMGIPMQVILWVGLFAMLFFKRRRVSFLAFRPLFILATFVLIHDFFYLFIANGNLNAFIMQILYFGCMYGSYGTMSKNTLSAHRYILTQPLRLTLSQMNSFYA